MQSIPVPESSDLPVRLDVALRSLVELTGPTVSFNVFPDPESVTEARHFALSRLTGWGLGGLSDDVGLVVSELVTNALRHSGGPIGGPAGEVPRWGAHSAHGLDDYGHRTYPPGERAGTAPGAGPSDPLGSAPAAIRLRMTHESPWVLCGIMDASPAAPRRKEPDYIAETGRGLHLVESFSARWGWRALPYGKVVWALFRAT